MQFTFEYGEILPSAEERQRIDDLMQGYSSAKRIAFNRLLEGKSLKEVVHRLESLDSLHLNWRYCEHASRDALAEIKSQRKLLPLYLSDAYDRIEEIEGKISHLKERNAKPAKVSALEQRLSRLTRRRDLLERHVGSGTIPRVIFGSRTLFVKRAKGNISNQEWKDARNNQLYSIGQANQRGNANVRIDGDRIGVNLPEKTAPREAEGRAYRVKNIRRWFALKVNEKFRKHMGPLTGGAYSVRVVRRNGRYLVQVSFEIALPPTSRIPERVCSIDSNPEGFAAAVVSVEGNMLAHRFFRDDKLIYASEEKRESIVGQLVAEVVAWAREHGAEAFAIEDLNIKGSRSFGRRGNRVVYAFVRRKFSENLMTRCWKEGYPAGTVNPAYTSKIGDAKYREMYGLSIHEAAALCIGRRFLGLGERLKEPMMVTVGRREERPRERVPVRYVWASVYGYQHPVNQRMEPPGRKGSAGERQGSGNEAVFTGRLAFERTPLTERGEGARKGGECGGSPQATGNGVKPASSQDGGKVTAAPLRDAQ